MCRIIIADDEVIERRVLEMMIGNDFPELELVPSVDNGLALIAGVEKYDPDIAVVDINMPGMNGLDALEMIRARNRRLKIIISTAYSEFEYAKKAISLEVSDYLLKPINRDSFQNILRRVIHQCQQEKETASQKADAKVHMDEMHAVVENEFLSSLMLGGRTSAVSGCCFAPRRSTAAVPWCPEGLRSRSWLEAEIWAKRFWIRWFLP